MARRQQKTRKQDRYEDAQVALWRARRRIERSPLGGLLDLVTIVECPNVLGDPEYASVDPSASVIYVNLHNSSGEEDHLTRILAHMLLHLGLNHAARREERDAFLWNMACEDSVDRLLPLFGLGKREFAGVDEREEAAYARLVEEQQQDKSIRGKRAFRTYAGQNRCDIMGLARWSPWRREYEEKLAEGIREAVSGAIEEAAGIIGDQDERPNVWRPAEEARRWVLTEFPLLGALATQIRLIADRSLCERLDIHVAAVDGFLGEMYWNPAWDFAREEMVFIYVHELLHVALLHHSRSRGRDPWLWNIACDFVINGWLVEMGVGRIPPVGALYDPRLQGMSSEEVYDLLERDRKRCKGLRGFRGKLGDVLLDSGGRRVYRGDVTTLDDLYRRCVSAGISCMSRGTLPAGLIEEIKSLFAPPVPWDVELARWMDAHVPVIRDPLRSYARASRRQSSTPDIPRPARFIPDEWKEACTFGVVMDTSGSMDRELLGRALGAIASYSEAREVHAVRLVLCDARPYDRGVVSPTDLRGIYPVQGRGGTTLQPAVAFLETRPDFPASAPVMIVTDGWCEDQIDCKRDHCFVLPRRRGVENWIPLRTTAPMFRVLKEEAYEL